MWNNNQDGSQFEFLDILAIMGFALQVANYQENSKQSSNDDLMQEMRQQDEIYLKKIIAQNEKIIQLLGG